MNSNYRREFFINKRIKLLIIFFCVCSFSFYANAYNGAYVYYNGYYLSPGFQNNTDQYSIKLGFRQKISIYQIENFLGGGWGWTKYMFAPDITYRFPHKGLSGLDVNLNLNIHFYYLPVVASRYHVFYPIFGAGMVNDRISLNNETHGRTRIGGNLGLGLELFPKKDWSVNIDFKNTFLRNTPDRMSFSIGVVYKVNIREH